MSEHTPGPWRVAGVHIASTTERVVASCYPQDFLKDDVMMRLESVDTCSANARLMAAAPDLLEALRAMQEALTEYKLRDIKKRFRLCLADAQASKAIAKATMAA